MDGLTLLGPDGRPKGQIQAVQLMQTFSLQDPQLVALMAATLDAAHRQRGETVAACQVVDRALELFAWSVWGFKARAQEQYAPEAKAHYGLTDPRDEPEDAKPNLQVMGEEHA